MSFYEDRITLFQIEEHEKELDRKKEEEKQKTIEEKQQKEIEKKKNLWQIEKREYKKKKMKLIDYEKQIDQMLKLMKISNVDYMGETYNSLL